MMRFPVPQFPKDPRMSYASQYRCPSCNGEAYIAADSRGTARIFVGHAEQCELRSWLALIREGGKNVPVLV